MDVLCDTSVGVVAGSNLIAHIARHPFADRVVFSMGNPVLYGDMKQRSFLSTLALAASIIRFGHYTQKEYMVCQRLKIRYTVEGAGIVNIRDTQRILFRYLQA